MFSELKLLPAFKGVEQHIKSNKDAWNKYLHAPTPEDAIPQCWTLTSKDKSGKDNQLLNC